MIYIILINHNNLPINRLFYIFVSNLINFLTLMTELLQKFSEFLLAPRSCYSCERKSCFVNKHCSDEWKQLLTKNKTTFIVPTGKEIFSKGEEVKGIFSIYSGFIKVYDNDEKSERIIDLVTGGQILGYRGLGRAKSIYSVSAKALSECEITFFPLNVFNLAIKSNSDLTFFLIDLLANKLNRIENRSKNFPNMQAKEKIIYALYYIIDSFGFDKSDSNKLSFTLSRKDIANIAGTTYETVIRVLSELDKQKLIAIDGKAIRILEKGFFKKSKAKWN